MKEQLNSGGVLEMRLASVAGEGPRQTDKHKSITNTMIGTDMLVIPLQFLQSVSIIIIGWASFKTCNVCIIHCLNHERDLSDVLERIMGKKWRHVFLLSSVLLTFVSAVAHFLLMLGPFYTILKSFFDIPEPNVITFKEFSHPWATLILITGFFCLFSINNLSFILRFNSIGITALLFFVIFVLVTAFEAIFTGNASFVWKADPGTSFPLVSYDIVTISGIIALAFLIHNLIIQIIRCDQNAKHNTRNLGIGYFTSGLVHVILGILGGIAVSWRTNCNAVDFKNHKSRTIMDCYTKEYPFSFYFMIVASSFVLLHLSTIIPMLVFVARNQTLELIFGADRKPPQWSFWTYNIVQTACMLAAGIFDLFPSTILAIDGAICGFGLLYAIPVFLHLKACSRDPDISTHDRLIFASKAPDNQNPSVALDASDSSVVVDLAADYRAQPKRITQALYGGLLVFGLGLLILQLYQTVVGIISSFQES